MASIIMCLIWKAFSVGLSPARSLSLENLACFRLQFVTNSGLPLVLSWDTLHFTTHSNTTNNNAYNQAQETPRTKAGSEGPFLRLVRA